MKVQSCRVAAGSATDLLVDSAEGQHNKGYAITMAEKLHPNAELVADDTPPR